MKIFKVYIKIYGIYNGIMLKKEFSDFKLATIYAKKLEIFLIRIIPIIKYIGNKHSPDDLIDLPQYAVRGDIYYEYEDLLNTEYKVKIETVNLDVNDDINWLNIGSYSIYQKSNEPIFIGTYAECKRYIKENNIIEYEIKEHEYGSIC